MLNYRSLNMKKIQCPNCTVSEIIHKFNSNKFQIYFCKKCLNGFTYPVPKDLSEYYSDSYWLPKGFLGGFKDPIYRFFQVRRKYWILNFLKKGEILDVGSGEGIFSKFMSKDFSVTSLDVPSSKIKNPSVIKVDFLKWNRKKKFDAIVFWESLEHTQYPQKYIKKASSILKKGGFIFIEYPQSNGLEAQLFKNYWFHLDPPRHLSHLTPAGLDKIFSRTKLKSVSHYGVLAFEYAPGGFVESVLSLMSLHPRDFFKNSKNLVFVLLLIPAIFISTILETIFFIFGQSPIYLTVARKTT